MNPSRRRKIGYLLGMVGLFTLVLFAGQRVEGQAERYRLAQKSLGKVNPVSGTAQFILAGMRGVAVTFLWHEAIELKKKQKWFEIRPVLESITLLQPNFVNPWTYQAWNMSYNIAAEWEAVADKYYWMREGIDFMKEATRTNQDMCDLEWYVGWLYHNRFGMSDERFFLREMFREEKDQAFAVSQITRIQDNFHCAYDWFQQGNATVLRLHKAPKTKGITPFMSYPAVTMSRYAEFLGLEGTFGEKAKNAWRQAREEWLSFGRQGETGRDVFMHRLEFDPHEWQAMTDEERFWATHYRKIVNYLYWRERARIEATDRMQSARAAIHQAERALETSDYLGALAEYEKALPLWRAVLDEEETLREDFQLLEDCQDYEARYLRVLARLDRPAPAQRPFEGLFPEKPEEPPRKVRDLQRPGQPSGTP